MRLAQPHAAVDEKGVVGDAGILGHLERGRTSQLVRFAGDEAVERETAVEPRPLEQGWGVVCRALCGSGRADGWLGATREDETQAQFFAAGFGCEALDARGEALAHQLQHEAVGRSEN